MRRSHAIAPDRTLSWDGDPDYAGKGGAPRPLPAAQAEVGVAGHSHLFSSLVTGRPTPSSPPRFVLELSVPSAEQRERLWRQLLPEKVPLASDISCRELAER